MKDKTLMYAGLLISLIISYFIFYYAFSIESWQLSGRHEVSDLSNHAKQVLRSIELGSFPAYTVWYRLVNIVSGFSLDFNKVAFTSIILLTGLVGAKYLVNYSILESGLEKNSTNRVLVALMSLLLIFVMPILTYYTQADYPNRIVVTNFHIYLGNIAPNQWHNSTLILAMPLNILWFFYSVKHINSNRLFNFIIMTLLAIAGIFCKPNFAMAFLPVLCMAVFLLNIKSRQYLKIIQKLAILAIPPMLLLGYQWYFTFIEGGSYLSHPTGTIFAPLLVWRLYSPNIIGSTLVSIAFPLSILFFYRQKIDNYLQIAWITFVVALSMFVFFAEYPVYAPADYEWASIAANYILFLFSAKLLINQPIDWKAKISYGIFLIHFLSGCFLVVSFFIKQTSLRI